MKTKIDTVKTLLEALPFIKEFRNQIVVIKYGGAAQTSETLKAKFAKDVLLMYLVGIRPVIVHGGGPRINEMLSKLDIPTEFIDGQRVTTPEVMRIVEMVLCGEVNNEIVALLNSHGASAFGVNGKDAQFLRAQPKDSGKWGLTGVIEDVKADVIHRLIDEKFIPVIAPIASDGETGHPGYNINADLAASKIAGAIGAKKVVFMTDTPGVLDGEGKLLSSLTEAKVEELKADKTIHGGMVPKVDACIEAIERGVQKAHIIDGRIEHAILLELFTEEGIGTQITL
ncbi:acetylglutamate kinase [Sulfurimonas sp. HSL1-6]|uniref:acetylglutamate kinase n=1 Tax=Thiomicrolovo immobilis TaxID=3131935 RepID=UPI0031F7E33F